ncbi:Auxin-induced protein 22B [Linum perenne]
MVFDKDLNLEATELRLGLPGTTKSDEPPPTPTTDVTNKKRSLPDMNEDSSASRSAVTTTSSSTADKKSDSAPPTKAQVVGWPPVRSFRKNVLQQQQQVYVKVSMDGAPYLRKIDLKVYRGYPELMKALEEMFKFRAERDGYINGSDFVPTYEDKDGDWMLVGDVPWSMFINCCKRLRIMKGSEARGLAAGGDGGGAV